jgi:hypothetical protein
MHRHHLVRRPGGEHQQAVVQWLDVDEILLRTAADGVKAQGAAGKRLRLGVEIIHAAQHANAIDFIVNSGLRIGMPLVERAVAVRDKLRLYCACVERRDLQSRDQPGYQAEYFVFDERPVTAELAQAIRNTN